jgi:hypothetical protein
LSDEPQPERRASTPIGNTDCVPAGTLVTVPAAPVTGGWAAAPVVAVNTVPWYKDPTFITTAGGALLSLIPVAVDALSAQTFNWRSFASSALLALAAYFRNRSNTVTR